MDPCMKKWLSRVPENKDAIERKEEKIEAELEERGRVPEMDRSASPMRALRVVLQHGDSKRMQNTRNLEKQHAKLKEKFEALQLTVKDHTCKDCGRIVTNDFEYSEDVLNRFGCCDSCALVCGTLRFTHTPTRSGARASTSPSGLRLSHPRTRRVVHGGLRVGRQRRPLRGMQCGGRVRGVRPRVPRMGLG